MKKLPLIILVIALFIVSCNNEGNQKVNLKTFNDSVSYAIGMDIANNFKQNKVDSLDFDILSAGMKNLSADDTSIMNMETSKHILMVFSKVLREKAEAEKNAQNRITYKNELESGQQFLLENAKKEGVITTDNGLQYKVIKEGNGSIPEAADKVKVHYEGTLIDGTIFDSSYERGEPAEFGLNQVIRGWTEALQMMKEGSIWELYIPYELAYGERGKGSIKPFSTLIFKVELIEVIK